MKSIALRAAVAGRPGRVSASVLALLAVLLCDGRAGAKPPSAGGYVNTGDPLPRTPVADRSCKDRRTGTTRWLDSDPHVPFFISARDHVESAQQACCAPWATRGSRWRAIGRYGEVVGTAVVKDGEGYDVTQCYELKLDVIKGEAGVGIFASAGGDWQPPKRSARWDPGKDEMESLARMINSITSLLDKPSFLDATEPWPMRWDDRILPFQIAADPDRGERGGRFAAVGGRVLVIARLDGKDWKLSHLDTSIALAGGDGVRPLAAFDVDGDAIPELIYHWNSGDSWADVVLHLDYQGWSQIAESIGGATA